jgi:replicative DNA helicase
MAEQRKININIPPNNIESEKALLGSILLQPDILTKIKKIIKSNYFYSNKHKDLFYAICYMQSKDIPVDLLTLTERLKTDNKLDEIGGVSYITELVSCVPSSSNAEHYAKIIKEKYRARKVIETSEIVSKMVNDNGKADESVKQTIKKLYEDIKEESSTTEELERLKEVAKLYNGDDKVVSFKEVYDRIKTGEVIKKIFTGWTKLDDIVTGFRAKQLIIMSGIMKHGKTSFAMDLTTRLSEYHPMWLAQEESVEELMEKFIERNEEAPHGYGPENATFVKTDWVEQKIIEGIVKYDTKIIFIDNLDFIRPTENNKNDSKADRIEQTVRELKSIAKKWNVVIILIVHVTKASKADNNPTFEDLKGSVSIGQLADKAIIVWRETERGDRGELVITNNTNVSVQLNRHGKTGNIKMTYDNGHYIERDWLIEKNDESFGDFSQKKLSTNTSN